MRLHQVGVRVVSTLVGRRLLKAAWVGLAAVVIGATAWVAWLLIGTNQLAGNRAEAAMQTFQTACRTTSTEPSSPSEVLAEISFPDSSPDASWPVVVGIGDEQLSVGVGWYPQTASPGAIGNMVLAGYRITNGAPFVGLLDLQIGDRVQLTTCQQVFTYVIDVAPADLTIQAGDDWVLDAVPGRPGQVPTGRMITLITSQDLLPTADRSVGFGHLESTEQR